MIFLNNLGVWAVWTAHFISFHSSIIQLCKETASYRAILKSDSFQTKMTWPDIIRITNFSKLNVKIHFLKRKYLHISCDHLLIDIREMPGKLIHIWPITWNSPVQLEWLNSFAFQSITSLMNMDERTTWQFQFSIYKNKLTIHVQFFIWTPPQSVVIKICFHVIIYIKHQTACR